MSDSSPETNLQFAPGGRVSDRLLERRDLLFWGVCFLVVSALIVASGFASRDPDSALYAGLSIHLAERPVASWIAPEWWGLWNSVGLFREHPAGIFFLPAALGRLGVPAGQAAYIVGIATGLACLLLLGRLVNAVSSAGAGRTALVLLQLVPAAFVFRIRSNHEYPMLLCLLVTLVALDGARRSWWWVAIVALALSAALLVKGVFVLLVLLASGLWVLLNPLAVAGSASRSAVALGCGIAAILVTALAYDAAYLRATGTTFWAGYWQRQIAPVSVSTPLAAPWAFVSHAGFYLAHLAWLSAPWGAALALPAWRWRRTPVEAWRALPDQLRRTVVFALAFDIVAIGLFSPSGRYAERYVFSPIFLSAAVGLAGTCHIWPALPRAVGWVDRRVPALPALVWLTLMVLRIGVGPLLPRIRVW